MPKSPSTFLSRFAAVPVNPAKNQMAALKRALQPKQVHKLTRPRKLIGSVKPIPPRSAKG